MGTSEGVSAGPLAAQCSGKEPMAPPYSRKPELSPGHRSGIVAPGPGKENGRAGRGLSLGQGARGGTQTVGTAVPERQGAAALCRRRCGTQAFRTEGPNHGAETRSEQLHAGEPHLRTRFSRGTANPASSGAVPGQGGGLVRSTFSEPRTRCHGGRLADRWSCAEPHSVLPGLGCLGDEPRSPRNAVKEMGQGGSQARESNPACESDFLILSDPFPSKWKAENAWRGEHAG